MHANTTKKHNLQGIRVKVCLQNNKIYIYYIYIYIGRKNTNTYLLKPDSDFFPLFGNTGEYQKEYFDFKAL